MGSIPTPPANFQKLDFGRLLPRPAFGGEQLDISQDKLSKLADIAYNVIIKIESGATLNPTIETMSKIAKGLGVSIDDLMK